LFAVLFGIAMIKSCLEGEKAPMTRDYSYDARTACERAITQRLKAPSTSKFVSGAKVYEKEGKYYVAGEVDAQNSFGAMIRTQYVCSMHRSASDQMVVDEAATQ
jgi:hypothetical protein